MAVNRELSDYPAWIQSIVREVYREPTSDSIEGYPLRTSYEKALATRWLRLAEVIYKYAPKTLGDVAI
jgi:hypothetical protein